MVNIDFKKDLFLLFCSFLFYFAFLVLNVTHDTYGSKENINLTQYSETPPEFCNPRYVNRLYTDANGDEIVKCVKIGIPENTYYEKSCEELELYNEDTEEECLEY